MAAELRLLPPAAGRPSHDWHDVRRGLSQLCGAVCWEGRCFAECRAGWRQLQQAELLASVVCECSVGFHGSGDAGQGG
jgi:hypothetical protein